MAVNLRPCHADLPSRGIEEVKGWMVPSLYLAGIENVEPAA